MRPDPLHYAWWLTSRASGVVALVLVSLAVLAGLAMAARVLPRPALKRAVARLHEHVALAALGAIAVHGLSLLGDSWLKPGVRGIAIPFAMSYRPAFTAQGLSPAICSRWSVRASTCAGGSAPPGGASYTG